MGLRPLVKEVVLRVLKENLGTTPSPDQPNPNVVPEKTIQVLKKWMEQAGSRDAAKRLIDFILKRRLGLGTDDLADTATFANGLDSVSEALEQQDWRGAIDIAKDTANEMIADEAGDGMEENATPTAEDPKDAYYVQYHSQRQGEVPFMLGERKFEYVNGLYPDGKVDIAVYAFAGDLCYGYNAFRKMMNLNEAFDPTSVGPNPAASDGQTVYDPYASMNAKMRQMEGNAKWEAEGRCGECGTTGKKCNCGILKRIQAYRDLKKKVEDMSVQDPQNPELPVLTAKVSKERVWAMGILRQAGYGVQGGQYMREGKVCGTCNGSGEGRYDGSKCNSCHGSGEEGHKKPLTKHTDPDYDWDAEDEERKLNREGVDNNIQKVHQEFNADIDALKAQHPNLSFGYIGNLTNDPRIGDNGDDRSWYVWNGRNKWGGFPTRDLPQMWQQWQTAKAKILGTTKENMGRYAQLAGATDLKEDDRLEAPMYRSNEVHFAQPTKYQPNCPRGMKEFDYTLTHVPSGKSFPRKVFCFNDGDFYKLIHRWNLTKTWDVEPSTAKLNENKSFKAIKNELDPEGKNHDLTLTCVKCGTTETCRCSKPKRKFQGICDKCSTLNEDAFDKFREELGADRVDEFLACMGLGPKYVPKEPKKHKCPKCKKENATYHEEGADCDGGQNEMVLECPDCGHSQS
jgi:hypothetical protein